MQHSLVLKDLYAQHCTDNALISTYYIRPESLMTSSLIADCPDLVSQTFLAIIHQTILLRGLGGVVVIDAAIGAHGKSRPRFKPGTLLHRCSDLGQVVNLSLSVA